MIAEQTHPQVELTSGRRRRRLAVWRSPDDQPTWARPALLAIAALAAISYAWGAGNYLEIYYAAAVRSMSTSWHDFVFAAFDPAGTVSLDKLPGAFWPQALAVRAFGANAWALVLPQVIEGTLTVLVLYRATRRLAGAAAGIVAAGVLVASPATTALNRGNIPDTLMILCLVLAADATVSALVKDSTWALLLAGVWVGLGFQAKMLEAWLVLPALALAFLVAAPAGRGRRLLAVSGLCAVTLAVSLSWMGFVRVVPASHRPYVDGSSDNSVFQQVFVYNGFGRIDEETPDQLLAGTTGLRLGEAQPSPRWDRLLTGALGRDSGWLIPAALVALVGGLVARRREGRCDVVRAGLLLWGAWLVMLLLAFTLSSEVNSYYTAALSPPIAGLLGTGFALAWQRRQTQAARALVALAVLLTAGYAFWLLPEGATGLPGWLKPVLLVVAVVAAVALVAGGRVAPVRVRGRSAFVAALAAACLVPAVATVSIVADRLGPFDTPFQPRAVTTYIWQFFGLTPAEAARTLPVLETVRHGAPYLMATQTSAVAATFIYHSGIETLPIGGFTGTIPEPTLASLKRMIAAGDFHLVLQSPTTTDPRLVWIARHCIGLGTRKGAGPAPGAPRFALYYCLPSSAGAPA